VNENLRSELLGTAGLSVAAVAALVLTVVRDPRGSALPARDGVLRVFLIGLALQCLHFAEEFITSFYSRFPLVLGRQPWSPEFFVAFNLLWLTVWMLSATGVRGGYRPAQAARLPRTSGRSRGGPAAIALAPSS
jgi:hypothetical protein